MNQLLYNIKKHGFRSVLVLLFAAVLLTVFLFTPDLAFRAPRQEYENNDVKNSRIIFSKPSGFYRDPFTLKIKAPTSEIYYTLDGTDPVRGQEGTFQYTREGVEITDATDNDNVHSMRTDVT
ncbi:MAG: FN3 associated domain-containing protein, partial [Lachnospiraceae bacterium]|nr:FN3 associated domain-containing protein [Lachnospiraceae bacterium]